MQQHPYRDPAEILEETRKMINKKNSKKRAIIQSCLIIAAVFIFYGAGYTQGTHQKERVLIQYQDRIVKEVVEKPVITLDPGICTSFVETVPFTGKEQNKIKLSCPHPAHMLKLGDKQYMSGCTPDAYTVNMYCECK